MGRTNVKLRFLTVFVASLGLTMTAQADDECDSILKNGVRNTYEWTRAQDLRSAYNREFCQKSSQQSSSNTGAGADVGYKFFEFNGEYSENDARSTAQESCDKNSGRLSDAGYQKLLQMTVSSEITEAWSKCRATLNGPIILGSINGSTLILEYRFRAAGNVGFTTVTSDPKVIGAACDDAVKKGIQLHAGGVSATCERQGRGPITAVLNTEFGTAKFFVPAIQERNEPPLPPARPVGPNAAAIRLSPPDGRRLPDGPPPGEAGPYLCVSKTPVPRPPGAPPQMPGTPALYGFCYLPSPSEGSCQCPIRNVPPPPWPQLPPGQTYAEWMKQFPIKGYDEGEIAIFAE